MFTGLGRFTTRHARVVVSAYLVILALAAVASIAGFGHGGLFDRMETSEYRIPDSESSRVIELTTSSEEAGPTSILLVSGIDLEDLDTEKFARDNRHLLEGTHIESVTDPFSIAQMRAEAEQEAAVQIEDEITEQVAAAMVPVEEQINASATKAKEAIRAQGLPPEQTKVALTQVDEQTQQALEEARVQVVSEVTDAVQSAADEAASSEENVAAREAAEAQEASLRSERGDAYAVIVTQQLLDDKAEANAAREQLDEGIAAYKKALLHQFPDATVVEVSDHSIGAVINEQIQADLFKGESLGLPVAALLMIIVFGGAIAAGLPLIGALTAITAGMGVLWVSTWVTSIDGFLINVMSIIGLSLSIDYGLLVVSRFREEGSERLRLIPESERATAPKELRRNVVVPAVRNTVSSAGRTVVFSAVTIALALSGIFFINVHALRTVAWGGIVVTLLAVLAAVTLIPALLTMMGYRLLLPSPLTRVPVLGRLMKAVGDSSSDQGFFSGLARWVQRRPWTVMIVVAAVLVLMATPVRDLELRNNFTDYIPDDSPVSTAYDFIQRDFPGLATPAIQAVVDADSDSDAVIEYVDHIVNLPGVEDVAVSDLAEHDGMSLIEVRVEYEDSAGPEVTQLVREMRELEVRSTQAGDTGTEPAGVEIETWVGGPAANQLDFRTTVTSQLPLALAAVALAVMVLLFLMTGSVIVPIKALIINGLSILASLGVTVAIFENGWLGVPPSPGLETFIVVCMIAFGFGLSMDYEVFLLARIKEFWDAGESNDNAVAKGLQRSGRIITSAAAIVIAVFIGFAMGDMVAIKQIGVGLAIMVAVDATLTRMLLVPATMTVMGKWNWWAPKPLARFAEKVGLRE